MQLSFPLLFILWFDLLRQKSIKTVIRKTEGRVFSHLNVFN